MKGELYATSCEKANGPDWKPSEIAVATKKIRLPTTGTPNFAVYSARATRGEAWAAVETLICRVSPS